MYILHNITHIYNYIKSISFFCAGQEEHALVAIMVCSPRKQWLSWAWAVNARAEALLEAAQWRDFLPVHPAEQPEP